MPHVLAQSYASLGYGYGYAFAEDNICALADELATVSAERSRYFGDSEHNLSSDFLFQRLIDERKVEQLLSGGATAPSAQVRDIVRGYAAGYNKYLVQQGVANLPDATCRGAEWVKPIDEFTLWRRAYQLALLVGSGPLLLEAGKAASSRIAS